MEPNTDHWLHEMKSMLIQVSYPMLDKWLHLCLYLLICKMDVFVTYPHWIAVKIQWIIKIKGLNTCWYSIITKYIYLILFLPRCYTSSSVNANFLNGRLFLLTISESISQFILQIWHISDYKIPTIGLL